MRELSIWLEHVTERPVTEVTAGSSSLRRKHQHDSPMNAGAGQALNRSNSGYGAGVRLLVLALAAVAVVLPLRVAALSGQPLAIFLHGAAARTRLLATYDTVQPIAIRVAGDARGFDAVTVTANGPNGNAITAPLVKGARGFVGTLRLAVPGTWTLALTTRIGSVTSGIAAVPIAVASPFVAEPFPSALVVLAGVSFLGGLVLIARPLARRV